MTNNQKKLFSLIVAAVLTLIIVFVWFSFSNKSSDDQIAGQSQETLSSISPLQMIKDEFSKVFSNFNNKVSDFENSSSTIPIEIIEATTTEKSI